MTIVFPQSQGWDSTTMSIGFLAEYNGCKIKCGISIEALQDHFKAAIDPMPSFQKNRDTIESKAEQLILANRFEQDGSILIRTADFP